MEDIAMIVPIAQVRMSTHHAHVSMSEDHIHVFKAGETGCDYCIFAVDDAIYAGDYILESLPDQHWRVSIEGDDEEWMPPIVNKGF
jgi:hypothetical protein